MFPQRRGARLLPSPTAQCEPGDTLAPACLHTPLPARPSCIFLQHRWQRGVRRGPQSPSNESGKWGQRLLGEPPECRAGSSGLALALCLLGPWGCCCLEEGGDAPTSALSAPRPTRPPWPGFGPLGSFPLGPQGVEWLTKLPASGSGQILPGSPCCHLCHRALQSLQFNQGALGCAAWVPTLL